MMKSEFIERTGFEPTAEEYKQIEQEYMGTDIDKDRFCKQWIKQGGIQRISRQRVRRIEELEAEVRQRTKEHDELDTARCTEIKTIQERYEQKISGMEEAIKAMQLSNFNLADRYQKMKEKCEEVECKLSVIREAFAILKGEGETAWA